jgi:hypothetical protein
MYFVVIILVASKLKDTQNKSIFNVKICHKWEDKDLPGVVVTLAVSAGGARPAAVIPGGVILHLTEPVSATIKVH